MWHVLAVKESATHNGLNLEWSTVCVCVCVTRV